MKLRLILLICLFSGPSLAEEAPSSQPTDTQTLNLSLSEALDLALKRNPNLRSLHAPARAESAKVYSVASPTDPYIGIQQNREGGDSKRFWTVSQSLKFPLKYYFLGAAQSAKGSARNAQYEDAKLALRAEVISTYYALYSLKKTIDLTKANIQALSEFSRIAERKYSAGTAPQQDSMRAHVEQTRLEVELRLLIQQRSVLMATLRDLLYEKSSIEIQIAQSKLPTPAFPSVSIEQATIHNSYVLQAARETLQEKRELNRLAKIDFIPDLKANYQRQFSGQPGDMDMIKLEVSIPLFATKKGGQAFSAGYELERQEAQVAATKSRLTAEFESLVAKAKTQAELLTIYETSLIPQASTTYRSTLKAYQANKSDFLALLDSERSTWNVEINYYRILTQYVRDLTSLERLLATELVSFSSPIKETPPQ